MGIIQLVSCANKENNVDNSNTTSGENNVNYANENHTDNFQRVYSTGGGGIDGGSSAAVSNRQEEYVYNPQYAADYTGDIILDNPDVPEGNEEEINKQIMEDSLNADATCIALAVDDAISEVNLTTISNEFQSQAGVTFRTDDKPKDAFTKEILTQLENYSIDIGTITVRLKANYAVGKVKFVPDYNKGVYGEFVNDN